MIYLIGTSSQYDQSFQVGYFSHFRSWLQELREVELDMETTVSKFWCEMKLRTIQFGHEDTQWVIQWSSLQPAQRDFIKERLEDPDLLKIIHNGMFECVIGLFHGMRIQSVYDTYLAEQVLYGGEHDIQYGLDDVVWRRLGIDLDKSYQTRFGEQELTPGHICYAAQDVQHLAKIRRQQILEAAGMQLDWVIALENEVLLVFAEMTFEGIEVNKEYWISLHDQAAPIVGAAEEKLNGWLQQEPFRKRALELGYIAEHDRVYINWNSGKQKKALFEKLFPELPGTSKAILGTWVSGCLKRGQDIPVWMLEYITGNTGPITDHLLTHHREFLTQEGLLVPAGTPTISWSSPLQVLEMFKCVARINAVNATVLGRVGHGLVKDYQNFTEARKLITTYGEQWLRHVEPDGKVRTRFNQVLTTGRISCSGPAMQQIPNKEETVGSRYMNAFVCDPGWQYVTSDFSSQELVIIAYLSDDRTWKEALRKGQDLHSIAAELVFKNRWKMGQEPGCAYYALKVNVDGVLEEGHDKCKCKQHKILRFATKAIDFGLAYGMSEFKLASDMEIPVPEAKGIIADYFRAFPDIGAMLDFLGNFGVENGYITTIYPFYRRRFFPQWKHYQRFIDAHLAKVNYHPGLGEIERASKNMPIQGTSADMMKVALVKAYWKRNELDLKDVVRFKLQVHDSAVTVAHKSYSNKWSQVLHECMLEAGAFFISTRTLKADTSINPVWSK